MGDNGVSRLVSVLLSSPSLSLSLPLSFTKQICRFIPLCNLGEDRERWHRRPLGLGLPPALCWVTSSSGDQSSVALGTRCHSMPGLLPPPTDKLQNYPHAAGIFDSFLRSLFWNIIILSDYSALVTLNKLHKTQRKIWNTLL